MSQKEVRVILLTNVDRNRLRHLTIASFSTCEVHVHIMIIGKCMVVMWKFLCRSEYIYIYYVIFFLLRFIFDFIHFLSIHIYIYIYIYISFTTFFSLSLSLYIYIYIYIYIQTPSFHGQHSVLVKNRKVLWGGCT